MLTASRAVLDHLNLRSAELFLAGWSQAGFVTTLLEKLESAGVPGLAGLMPITDAGGEADGCEEVGREPV
jgi:hypothetical protein